MLDAVLKPFDSKFGIHWYTSMTGAPSLERDRAYKMLLDMIVSDKHAVDQPLSERKLADTMGLGRTPVREALKRLTSEGLIEAHPARGTFIRQLDRREIEEMYEVRLGIEGLAAYLAAKRGATDQFKRFRRDFPAMIAEPDSFDLAHIHQVGQDFHVEMVRAAGNDYLFEIYEPIRIRNQVALRLPRHYDADWVQKSVAEHLSILEAIDQGRAEVARQRICRHLIQGLNVRSNIFDSFGLPQLDDTETKAVN